jgi:hypothetical protein
VTRRLGILLALALAVPIVSASPTPAQAAAAVKITLSCYSNPEKTTITNNSASSITIKKVGSTYQPYSYEPITVNRSLAPGAKVTFQSGNAATRNVLTRNYIYNNNGLDGAKVVTSIGSFTKRC